MEFDVELSGPDGALIRTSGRQNRLQAHELHACADPGCLGKVHNLLASVWGSSPDVTETDRAMFETAVIEIGANIVRHGSDEGRTVCNLILEVYPDRLDARFKDDGLIADVDIAAAAMPDTNAESGRSKLGAQGQS